MKDWMTIKDLSEYLQISEVKINFLIRNKDIPFYDHHGFLRFKRDEIDEWMATPVEKNTEPSSMKSDFIYRGKPIDEYVLTATIIFLVSSAWLKLPEFVVKSLNLLDSIKGRDFLYRDEFDPLMNNFYDYLRVSCQLGLIDNMKEEERKKHYYITEYSRKIYEAKNLDESRNIIQESILDIVRKSKESLPDERHAVYLLWYYLSLKESGVEPEEHHFRKSEKVNENSNYFPKIRLSFSKSLCDFLFEGDKEKEQNYLREWNSAI